jgi:very-short-patch-repair endonuclease
MARSVIAGDEKLAAEYDVARNGPLEQKNITMNQPISWRCQRYADHPPWEATLKDRIADRLDGNLIFRSCPRCACTSNPRIQRALTQMITNTLGINVEEGLEISGYFPDAYLPDYRTILEYDGPYHCPIKDELKDRLWISGGYRVFRLRDGSLPNYKNTGATVRDTPELAIESFAECATNLGSLLLKLPLQSEEQRLISKLANGRLLTREQIFQFKAIPSFALSTKSAAEIEPWLLRYASPRNLYPLTNYTKSANVSYLWLCPICAHEYPLSIANRVRNFVCKKCWSVFKTSPQKEAIKAWIMNSEKPRQVPLKLLSS